MKVKEIVEKYGLDELEFDRFMLIKDVPCKKTFSGTIIPDEDVENQVRAFHDFQASFRKDYTAKRQEEKEAIRQHNQRLGLLFSLEGVRGRTLMVCKTKCIIKTEVTVGSVVTGNATDGEKVIFYKDCSGIQFKKSGLAIGYLQFETSSMQMNNQNSNFFSENTFTFEENAHGITNAMMEEVFYFMMDLIEQVKYEGMAAQVPAIPALVASFLASGDL